MNTQSSLSVTSPAFQNDGYIPAQYTCDGNNTSPEIDVRNLPTSARSLVLIMDDPDAPAGTFDHWIMWNIPPDGVIHQNSSPGVLGKNSAGENKYKGPCPPSGTHRYFFKVYALDTNLGLKEGSTKKQVEEAMKGHILASGQLIGKYQRPSSK